MFKRIIPVFVVCCVLVSAICSPAAAAETYLEPFADNTKESYSDTQYIYDHCKVSYNGHSDYTVHTGSASTYYQGNTLFHDGKAMGFKVYAYPMGRADLGETFVSLESLRKNGEELLSVRIPIIMALANTGYNYKTDVVVAIDFYDSAFNELQMVSSSETVYVKGSNAWFFIDPGAIDIPNIPNAAYFSIRFNVTVDVEQWIKLKWGSLELVTRRSKSDEIINGSPEDQERGEEFQENMGNTAGGVISNNDKLTNLTPTRPPLNTNIQLDNQTVIAVSPLISRMWAINGLQSQVGIVFVVAAMAYVFFGKRDG